MTVRAAHAFFRLKWQLRLGAACFVLLLLVVFLSAFIRLAGQGFVCDSDERCHQIAAGPHQTASLSAASVSPKPGIESGIQSINGERQSSAAAGAHARDLSDVSLQRLPVPWSAIQTARTAHRLAASASLLLILLLLGDAVLRKPRLRPEAVRATALLVLALGLAVLGILAGSSQYPAVVLGNLLGGFLMLAIALELVARLACRAASNWQEQPLTRTPPGAVADFWLVLMFVWAVLQVMLGGMASAVADPFWWRLLHAIAGFGLGALVLGIIVRSWRAAPQRALFLLVVLALQILLGLYQLIFQAVWLPVLLHNGLAAILLASLLVIATQRLQTTN